MTRAMAFELAGKNIYVNAVAPGPIMTEGMSDLIQRVPSVHESRVQDVPMGRFGTPEEIAESLPIPGQRAVFLYEWQRLGSGRRISDSLEHYKPYTD